MAATHSDNFDAYASTIERATNPSDLFGGLDVDVAAAKYRKMSKKVHPDRVDAHKKVLATEVFAKLSALWDEFNGKVEPIVIKTKRGEHPLGDLIAEGHIANVYASGLNVVKMPRSAADNDLMEREAKALKKLDSEADPQFRMYAPKLVETFRHKDEARVLRRVNVLERLDGFHTLEAVRAAYRGGLDPRDLAWIWRRLFVAVGLAADNGLVHGAITPDNIMIHGIDHGVVIVDWTSSCELNTDQVIPTMVPDYESFYPSGVEKKAPPTYATDIEMLAQVMRYMLDPLDPHTMKFRAFARGCMVASPPPAAQLLAEFDELLADTYGKRRYRKLEMPA